MVITEHSAYIARIDALRSIVDDARVARGLGLTHKRVWDRIAFHVDRRDADRREAKQAEANRVACLASYVAEGLGEWVDHCPSDND
jgi:hypothetical protein